MATNNAINLATPTSTTLVISQTSGALSINTPAVLQTGTGFATWGGAGVYFDDTTLGDFVLKRPGTGYIKGVLVSWTAPQTVNGLAAGNCYHIYIDSTGTIGKTATRTDALFEDNIVLFECLRDSTAPTNNQVTVKENHPYSFEVEPSNYLHDVIGNVIVNKNNGANIVLNGTKKIQINGEDEYEDHGLETTIPDSAGAAVAFKKYFTNAAGKWCLQNGTDTFSGYWNNAGTPTVLTAGRFGVYTLYASKDNLNVTTPVYIAVMDIAQYTSTSSANNAISAGTIAQVTNELRSLEMAQLGYIIFRQSTDAIVQVTISKATLRQTLSAGGASTAALVNTVTTNFNSILSSADSNVQAALDTIDNYGVSPYATGDSGGVLSTTSLTNVVNTTQGVGALTILSTNGNSGTNAGFIKMYQGTTIIYIPYWTTIAP